MAIPNTAITRNEQYLAAMAGQSGTLPDAPITRKERYLAKAAGQDVETPEPITREEMYLDAIAEGGGGGGGGGGGEAVLVNKTVSANGTYLPSADSADGYKKVVVNVPTPTPTLIAKTVTANGTYSAEDDNADGYSSVTVDVAGGEPSEVPSGYTQLKYVESSGTQAINTGVAPTLETKLQIQGYYLEGNQSYYPLGGCANPPITCGAVAPFDNTTCFNSFGNKSDQKIDACFSPYHEAPVFTINKTQAVIKTCTTKYVALGATTMSGNTNTRICLFARGNAGDIERNSKCRIFRAKIWENGTLLRDFVPALENAAEEVGMYDIVNNVFYRNVGTGVFIGGER